MRGVYAKTFVGLCLCEREAVSVMAPVTRMPPCTKCGGLVLSTQSREQDEWYCLCCGKRTWQAWPVEDVSVLKRMKGCPQTKFERRS